MYGLVTDESFDLNKTNEYILSIQVSLDGFSFSVIHPDEKRLLALQHTPLTISNERFITRRFNEWLESEQLLQKIYHETRLVAASEKFTLIPDSLYSSEQKELVIQSVFETDGYEEIGENFLETYKIHLLFALQPQLQNTLKGASIVHPVKMLIEKKPEITSKNGLILWFNSEGCYFVLMEADQIILVNHFKVSHENDVIYYVLSTLKQLRVSPTKTQLFMAGEMAEKKSLRNLFQNYFALIDFLHPEKNLKVDKEKFTDPLHPFIHLYI